MTTPKTDPWPEVARLLDLACPDCGGNGWIIGEARYEHYSRIGCKRCGGDTDEKGTGRIFPLRKPCSEHQHYGFLSICRGNLWTPITDFDSVLAAVRGKGGGVTIISESAHGVQGDSVVVRLPPSFATVIPSEGLRGTLAVGTALLRVLNHG